MLKYGLSVCCLLLLLTALLPPCQAQEATPSEQEALEAYRQGAFGRAVQLYRDALSETSDPKHRARLQVRIAWTLFALGREGEVDTHLRAALVDAPDLTLVPDYYTQEFLDLFEQARQESFSASQGGSGTPPPDLEITIGVIEQRISIGTDLEGALADVDRLISAYPQDGRLIPYKIQLLESLGRQAEADELRLRIDVPGTDQLLDRLSISDLILRANQYLDQNDTESSLELLREAVARQPSNVAALELMAEAAQYAGHWKEARYALTSALALQPDSIGLRLRLGEVHLAMDEVSAARDVFRMLTEQYPHSDRAWAALGLLDARLGARDRALTELEKALRENPLLPEVQLAYGELLLLEGRFDEALESLRSASNLLQDDPQVEARVGQVLLALDRPADALLHLRAAVDDGFTPTDVQRALALAQVEAGLLAEAQRALDQLPSDPAGDSKILQAYLLLQKGSYAEAEGLLTRAAEQRSNDPELLNLLGAALYLQARYDEAVGFLTQAQDLSSGSEIIAANLARAEAALAAEQLGRNAQAVTRAPSR